MKLRRVVGSSGLCLGALGTLVVVACTTGGQGSEGVGTARDELVTSGAVLTYHGDIGRTGQFLAETRLSGSTLSAATFGRLFSVPVDGKIYAQPLFVPSLPINGASHDVVIVATESDSLYAIDAYSGAVYWKRKLGHPVPWSDVYPSQCQNLYPTVGITGTPVIDPTTGYLYVVAASSPSAGIWQQTLFQIDVASGTTVRTQPITSQIQVSGDGPLSVNGKISFDPRRANQRAGLLLENGQVTVAWASHCDDRKTGIDWGNLADPKPPRPPETTFGWVMAFDSTTLSLTHVFNTDPHADPAPPSSDPMVPYQPYGGSIWQGGAGLASDGQSVYVSTGNGLFLPGGSLPDYGDSILKLGPALGVNAYFTPFNQASLRANDHDLASGGLVLLPPLPSAVPAHPNLMIMSGKEGRIYLLDRDQPGGAQPTTGDVRCLAGQAPGNCVVAATDQQLGNPTWDPDDRYFGVPAYFNGRVFFGGSYDPIKAYAVGGSGALSASPVATSNDVFAYPGAIPTVSASSATDAHAVVWAVQRTVDNSGNRSANLMAYDWASLGAPLYSSASPGRRLAEGAVDGDVPQFVTPTVSHGHVYVGGTASVTVYGAFDTAAPVIATSSGGSSFGANTVVTLTDGTPGAVMYYTLDGSQPSPGAPGSIQYVSPFTVYSSVTVKARAFGAPTQLNMLPSDVSVRVLSGTCHNAYPTCGTDGAQCSTCDDRSNACATTGACICGTANAQSGTACALGSWCWGPSGFLATGCTFQPTSGSWYDPARSGWGLGVSVAPTTHDLYVQWFTYLTDGSPIWYVGDLPRNTKNGGYSGQMAVYRYVNGAAVQTIIGTMAFSTTSATAGTFSWDINAGAPNWPNGSTGSEPVQYMAFGSGASVLPITGDWYAPSQSGWGEFFDVQGTSVVADVALYDGAGNPAWLYGSNTATSSGFTISLYSITGKNLYPGATGTPSTSFTAEGSIQVSGVNGLHSTATLSASLLAPYQRWNTAGIPIARLTR